MRWRRIAGTIGCAVGAACAEPNPPLPPPVDVLVVANVDAGSISLVAVQASLPPTTIPLGAGRVTAIAAWNHRVLAVLPDADAVALVDLRQGAVLRTLPLPAGSGAAAAVFVDDSIAFVAAASLNTILRLNVQSGSSTSLTVGQFPAGLLVTRGRVFVVNANVTPCAPPQNLCTIGSSWMTVVNPENNTRAEGRDSIPIPGPGNARYAAVGGDGLIYTLSRGDGAPSRLSIIDPVDRDEIASFGGFGADPGEMASDGEERLFISSPTEGLMEFNTRTRAVVRGSGNGVNIPDNAGVAVDADKRVYAVEAGDCASGTGAVQVLDSTLAAIRTVGLGRCAGPALVTRYAAEEP